MKCNKSLVATLISACLCVPAIADEDHGGYKNKFYLGIGGGVSRLSPDIEQGVNLTVDDKNSSGGKVFVGWDFHPHLGVELGYADLGEADIGPNSIGSLEYTVADLSALYHFYNAGGYDRLVARRGLGAFWKVGVGMMDNDVKQNNPASTFDYRRDNDWHLMGGLGVEYGIDNGLAFRGEIEAFDEDALLASVGVLWRMGAREESVSPLFDKADGNGSIAPDDDDADGVSNNLDDCPDTLPGDPVSATGCAMFGGVLDGVLFESGSDTLTEAAEVVLNDAADVLLNYPNVSVEIQAHTDSQGSAGYNLELSKKRALSTVRYMMLRGVPSEQLQARAFGESKPIESNDTAEGRQANRRVEFHVTSK
ncbi:hypothetical protein AB833_07020 [Chromatiales bacterium (ex Bugula neritina AB1)]|nr:hypothetical protein AB833_07020 [Chromatiales bacterium (ex Bugula neritina AB1)]